MEAFAIIGDAWRLVWRQPGRILKACFILFAAPMILSVIFAIMGAGDTLNTALNGVGILFSSWLAVVFHRAVLINEDSGWGLQFYSKPILKYIGLFLMMIAVVVVFALLAYLVVKIFALDYYIFLVFSSIDPTNVGFGAGISTGALIVIYVLFFIFILVITALSIRYSVVFPSVSVETPFMVAIRATRKKFWTFFLLGLLDVIILIIFTVLFTVFSSAIISSNSIVMLLILGIILYAFFTIAFHAQQAAIYARYVSPVVNTKTTAEVFE